MCLPAERDLTPTPGIRTRGYDSYRGLDAGWLCRANGQVHWIDFRSSQAMVPISVRPASARCRSGASMNNSLSFPSARKEVPTLQSASSGLEKSFSTRVSGLLCASEGRFLSARAVAGIGFRCLLPCIDSVVLLAPEPVPSLLRCA